MVNLFVNELTNWKHNDKNMLLNNALTPNVKRIDGQLYKLLKNFELLTYVNPTNVKTEKAKFFNDRVTNIEVRK